MSPIVIAIALAGPWISDPNFPQTLQGTAAGATLQVHNGNNIGTAVRVGQLGRWMYYLTAAHVVGDSTNVDLEQFEPKTGKSLPKWNADVKKVWKIEDLALLRASEPHPGPVLKI